MRTAFKEWTVIVDALGRGEQIIVLRKGGIHDNAALFEPEHQKFWLFPTLFHQQSKSVIAPARRRFETAMANSLNDRIVEIQYFAEITQSAEIRSLEIARKLRDQHIWEDDVIEQRFEWGTQRSVYALLLRVFQIPTPQELPRIDAYGGCRSWIELDHKISETGMRPVLTDAEYQERAVSIVNILGELAGQQ